MKTDKDGVSTCKNGEEYYEYFGIRGRKGKYCQYDFRAKDGELFTVVRQTLTECRECRDKWLANRG